MIWISVYLWIIIYSNPCKIFLYVYCLILYYGHVVHLHYVIVITYQPFDCDVEFVYE